MKRYILFAACGLFTLFGLQSCLLDYDTPGDELTGSSEKGDYETYFGKADVIDYHKEITEDGFISATDGLKNYFGQIMTAQYALRGGKEGGLPGAHAYQYQFNLTVDNYAGYFCLPHNFDGRIRSTYYVNEDFNGGPNGSFGIVKNNLIPILNHPQIDSIPEFKAIALLLFNYGAQDIADIYSTFPYKDFKANKQDHPFTYDSHETIYKGAINNIDTIVACFKNYPSRPDWYKKRFQNLIKRYDAVTVDKNIDTWCRFANSLKLRMAMRLVKVEPELAKKWAEEAVAAGVVETLDQEIALTPMMTGFTNPLLEISKTWGDTRLNASFESLLSSLDHPYMKYYFLKNENKLIDLKDPTKFLEADSRVVGIRAGTRMIPGQSYANNQRIAYSRMDEESTAMAPLYLMKISEVDFLRAEGALRGWNMGGQAGFFYNRGIDNAYLDDRFMSYKYDEYLADYKTVDTPVNYTYIDPLDSGNNIQSVTKIGVKWSDGDSQETKLEKIITQKYIALFPDSHEAWAELRRTGYPKIFPVLNVEDGDDSLTEGEIIRRMPLLGDTDAMISDILTTGLEAIGGDDVQATRLWWDTDTSNF